MTTHAHTLDAAIADYQRAIDQQANTIRQLTNRCECYETLLRDIQPAIGYPDRARVDKVLEQVDERLQAELIGVQL